LTRFFPSGFFMNQFAPMQPQGIPLESFRIFSKIRGDICMSGVHPPVSTTLVVHLELRIYPRISPSKQTAEQPMGGQEVYMYLTITVQIKPPPPPRYCENGQSVCPRQHSSHCGSSPQLITWGMVIKLVIAGSVG
jgi:hypothetical protein